jgi:hypothetical protein
MFNKNNIYLVAFYGMKPRKGVNTSKKGWMDNKDNLQYDEKVEITRGHKKSSALANVILNLSQKTVERNTFNDDRDFRSFFKYYFGGYDQYITAVMKQLDPEYLTSILDELEAEMQQAEADKHAQEIPSA